MNLIIYNVNNNYIMFYKLSSFCCPSTNEKKLFISIPRYQRQSWIAQHSKIGGRIYFGNSRFPEPTRPFFNSNQPPNNFR